MRRALGLLSLGVLVTAVLLSLLAEQIDPWELAVALLGLAGVARSGVVRFRSLLFLAVDVLIVFAYLWTLGESLHVVIHAERSRSVVVVGGRSAVFPPAGPGRIGLYAASPGDYPVSALGDAPPPASGPAAWVANTLRFLVPGPAWAHVHLAVAGSSPSGVDPFPVPAGGWHRNARGELEGIPGGAALLSGRSYTRYTLSADLMRPGGTQGMLVGVSPGGRGYLLAVRMDAEAASWNRWWNGSISLAGGAPFKVAVVGMVQRVLAAVLPSALISLLLVAAALIVPFAVRTRSPASSSLGRLLPRPPPRATDALALVLALGGGGAAAVIASALFARIPNVQDAVAYLFQAKTLALGRLWVPLPAQPAFFRVEFLPMVHGHWFGKYPPGWPLLLALGVMVGQPWLVGPMLVAADLLLLYWIGRMAYGRGVALVGTLFAATSPLLLFLGASFLAHAATLFFASGFVALVMWWETGLSSERPRSLSRRWESSLLVAAGFLLGMAFLTRELDALAFALPFAALFLRRPGAGGLVLGGAALPAAAWLAYNRILTGSFTTTPYTLWWSFDRIGFGPTIGGPGTGRRGYTVAQGVWNMGSDLQSLQAHLFGWPFYLALALAAVPFVTGREGRWDLLFASSACSVVIAYLFYFNPGLWLGPRYYYVIIPWLALLSARGLAELYRLGMLLSPQVSTPSVRAAILPAILGGALVAYDVGFYIPAQLPTYRTWNADSSRTANALRAAHIQQGLVFIAGSESVWDAAFSLDSPLLTGSVIYARDEGSRDTLLTSVFPHRAGYRYTEAGPKRRPYVRQMRHL